MPCFICSTCCAGTVPFESFEHSCKLICDPVYLCQNYPQPFNTPFSPSTIFKHTLTQPFSAGRGGTLIYTRLVFREKILPQNLGSLWGFKGMITNPLDEALSSFTILPDCMKLSVCLSYMSRGTKAILLLLLKQKLCPPPPLRGEVMFAPKTYIKPEISPSTYVWLTF